MSLFPSAKQPASLLGYHRILSPTAGVRVSPLCLGAMDFGKENSFKMLDLFYLNGGKFIWEAEEMMADRIRKLEAKVERKKNGAKS